MKAWLGNEVHLEVARGTPAQNVKYCTKEESRVDGTEPHTYGVLKEKAQGGRTDLYKAMEDITEMSKLEFIEENPHIWFQYRHALEEYRCLKLGKAGQRSWEMEVIVLYGATGTGKTRFIVENCEDIYWLRKSNGGAVWFDGYNGEHTVAVDDFYSWLPFDFMLRFLDRYPLRVDKKGGSLEFTSKRIVFTSNIEPDKWYPNVHNENMRAALFRRFNGVAHFRSQTDIDIIKSHNLLSCLVFPPNEITIPISDEEDV